MLPLLSDEIDINQLKYSDEKVINNMLSYLIRYETPEQLLYIQSPLLKYLYNIVKQTINNKTYYDLYLFFIPTDDSYKFINKINDIENVCYNNIKRKKLNDKEIKLISVINKFEDNENTIKFMKVKLLDTTIIEYNNR